VGLLGSSGVSGQPVANLSEFAEIRAGEVPDGFIGRPGRNDQPILRR
jgi:hypothetical protein